MAVSKSILLLGEAWGQNEAKIAKPFVGSSGVELIRMLSEARVLALSSADRDYISRWYQTGDPNQLDMVWQLHPEFYRTNVFNLHPQANAIESLCGDKANAILGYPKITSKSPGYVQARYSPELDRLGDEILAVDPNLIIAMGNTPLWALCGKTGVSKLRGTTCLSTHTVGNYKLLVTYHPAAVIRQWELRPTTVIDLAKANHESNFPEVRRPNCEIWIEPSLEDIETFLAIYIRGCRMLSVDIETSGQQITCLGFAPRSDLALVIPIHDERTRSRSYWPNAEAERQCWRLIRSILEDQRIPKVFQNGLYDIAFLWRAYGIGVLGATEDTMLLHHALQPESLKGLGFLGSVYTNHGPWKSERHTAGTLKRDS
jgi:uracil-DNA glycosylase